MILICWVESKVNGLDLGNGLGPKVNGLDLRSEFGPNRLGWPKVNGLDLK